MRDNRGISWGLWSGIVTILFLGSICCIAIHGALGENSTYQNETNGGTDISIINASARMDVFDTGDIPLGTIPEESLVVSVTVKNNGKHEAPGYKIKAYLVKPGDEDEISTEIGSDIVDSHLGPGETRSYEKIWSLPLFLKKGEYKPLFILDSSNYFEDEDTGNNRYISDQSIIPGTFTGSEGSIPVYSPAEITEPGYYVLKRDINADKKLSVFRIKSSGVTLDGGGHKIYGTPTGFTTAISIDSGKALQDFTIQNLAIEDFDVGIGMYKVNNARIKNCTFKNLKNMGLRLDVSQNNEVTGNTFEGNNIGIGVFQSKDNLIYNNLFKNQFNAVVNDDQKNRWNIEPVPGINILGGELIGGNAWFNSTGNGFSVSAADYAHDGIADTPYVITQDNMDLYPLSSGSKSFVSPPSNVTESLPVPAEGMSIDNELVNQISNKSSSNGNGTLTEKPGLSAPDITQNIKENKTEGNISNNKGLSSHADISPIAIKGPETACLGEEINISVTLENAGGYDADSFLMMYYLSEDQKIDENDIYLGETTINGLQSQKEETFGKQIRIPESTGLKKYYLGVVTNPGMELFEDKKENNNGFSTDRINIRSC